jgi:hypothetical protein
MDAMIEIPDVKSRGRRHSLIKNNIEWSDVTLKGHISFLSIDTRKHLSMIMSSSDLVALWRTSFKYKLLTQDGHLQFYTNRKTSDFRLTVRCVLGRPRWFLLGGNHGIDGKVLLISTGVARAIEGFWLTGESMAVPATLVSFNYRCSESLPVKFLLLDSRLREGRSVPICIRRNQPIA